LVRRIPQLCSNQSSKLKLVCGVGLLIFSRRGVNKAI
jgi:hypothetical protein